MRKRVCVEKRRAGRQNPPMLLLALETSSLAGSVALFENDVCRAVAEFRNGREQGREVLLQSGKLLENRSELASS